MPAAVNSVLKTGIALAGAGAIAVSPLVPAHDVQVPTVNLPSIELTALPVPALGAIPYQVGVNTLGNVLALAPILIGSTGQCLVCIGPQAVGQIPPSPFTGWGLIGIGAGLISSPLVFFGALGDGSVTKALGAALLAIQVPITNTFSLLGADRIPVGGFALQATLDRVFQAGKDSVDGLINVLAQALVTGPLGVVKGAVAGATAFAGTLAQTGDLITAFNAGRAPFEAAVNSALKGLTDEISKNRAIVYADLTGGPGVATSPIPTLPPPPPAAATRAAAAEESSGPVTKVTDSAKAVPNTTAGSSDDHESGSAAAKSDTANEGSSAPAHKTGKSTGSSKRQHRSDSAA